MATLEQIHNFLRDQARGSLSRQTQISAAVAQLKQAQHESSASTTSIDDKDLSRVESQVSTMDVPDERNESDISALKGIKRLPKDSTLAALYREVLQHQSHQFEMKLGEVNCVVVTNCLLEEAQVVSIFLHGLGASPWHFVKLGFTFLHDYLGQQVLKKGKFFNCKAAFIFPFGLISMAENEFGAVEDTVYGSYKWWDIFNADGTPLGASSPPATPTNLHPQASGIRRTPRTQEGLTPSPSASTLDTDYSQFIKEQCPTADKEPFSSRQNQLNFAQASPIATPSIQRPFCWCLKPETPNAQQNVQVTARGWNLQSATNAAPLDNPIGRPKATAAVCRFIGLLRREYGISKLVLGGFSQGAMLALDVFFHLDNPPQFLAIFSGAPMCIEAWKDRITSASLEDRRKLKNVPILESHGNRDWVFPVFVGRWLNRFLRRNGFYTRYIEFDGEHELSEEAIDAYHHATFQLALEGNLGVYHITSIPSQQSIASPTNQLPGFSKTEDDQTTLQDTFDDFLYKAGYAVAACVLPVAKKIG